MMGDPDLHLGRGRRERADPRQEKSGCYGSSGRDSVLRDAGFSPPTCRSGRGSSGGDRAVGPRGSRCVRTAGDSQDPSGWDAEACARGHRLRQRELGTNGWCPSSLSERLLRAGLHVNSCAGSFTESTPRFHPIEDWRFAELKPLRWSGVGSWVSAGGATREGCALRPSLFTSANRIFSGKEQGSATGSRLPIFPSL